MWCLAVVLILVLTSVFGVYRTKLKIRLLISVSILILGLVFVFNVHFKSLDFKIRDIIDWRQDKLRCQNELVPEIEATFTNQPHLNDNDIPNTYTPSKLNTKDYLEVSETENEKLKNKLQEECSEIELSILLQNSSQNTQDQDNFGIEIASPQYHSKSGRQKKIDIITTITSCSSTSRNENELQEPTELKLHGRKYVTPKEAAKLYKHVLPIWEISETRDYPRIWYVGLKAKKAKQKAELELDNQYNIELQDHVDFRYEVLGLLGNGTFGKVFKALDHGANGTLIALKIFHTFNRGEDYGDTEVRTDRAVSKIVGHPECYSTFKRTFRFRSHWCATSTILGETLVVYRRKPLSLNLLRKYARDVLKAIFYFHQKNFIHGDIKPENILQVPGANINSNVLVRIGDFTCTCVLNSEEFPCPESYFQSRPYRAPEVILELPYNQAVDMWSFGILLTELYIHKIPLYGENQVDQLAAIMEVLGFLPAKMVVKSGKVNMYRHALRYVTQSGFKRRPYRKPLPLLLRTAPMYLVDLIQKCLQLDPTNRITAKEAMRHPFFSQSQRINALRRPRYLI